MGRKGLRRLELWLPDNHFIWAAPPGYRAALARSYLNLAPLLEAQSEMLREALSRLARLEEKLAALEARMEAGGALGQAPGQRQQGEPGGRFDAAGFFGMF
ncbi:hypothetical protein [Desulfovirgula thermocuniculi]|uniref:hypothetical protein n=1 Tax=Desulfovirgula thermocuniculi TaxID=348842 RepID=UPI000489C769|nr:hypothetical protein [Desulfovirgula thermocuniculi]